MLDKYKKAPKAEEEDDVSCKVDDIVKDEGETNSIEEVEIPKKKTRCICISFLKSRGYWDPLIKTIQFWTHFLVVMLALFGGAILFVLFEDPDTFYETFYGREGDAANNSNPINGTDEFRSNSTMSTHDNEALHNALWSSIEQRYNISVSADERRSLFNKFKEISTENKTKLIGTPVHDPRHGKMFVFLKWFYFVTIATSTIGYGDVSPKTENGKLFYIAFSVIGIALMMTLLRRCGTIISFANRKVYGLINRHICRNSKIVSEELLSTISITIIFLGYLFAGIWYGRKVAENIEWSLVDVVYYWIVTFSTVGFGDITHPLQHELDNVHVYVVYRLFGLAFISAIIDSIQVYVESKEKAFQKRKSMLMRGLSQTQKIAFI